MCTLVSVPDSLPKGEGESGTVVYRKPLWATVCVRIPKYWDVEDLKEVLG